VTKETWDKLKDELKKWLVMAFMKKPSIEVFQLKYR
jgi:hypothetical protein